MQKPPHNSSKALNFFYFLFIFSHFSFTFLLSKHTTTQQIQFIWLKPIKKIANLTKPIVPFYCLQVVLVLVAVVLLLSVSRGECRKGRILEALEYSAISCRAHSASLVDFGGVGDGQTLNTKAFQDAVSELSKYGSEGGAQLYVPAGKWLTGSFSLTSHFTLFLHRDAVLLASQVSHLHFLF